VSDEPRRIRCGYCTDVYTKDVQLSAPNPFDPKDMLTGCPFCKSVNMGTWVCDEPGCSEPCTMGTPTPAGYRITCWKHYPDRKEAERE